MRPPGTPVTLIDEYPASAPAPGGNTDPEPANTTNGLRLRAALGIVTWVCALLGIAGAATHVGFFWIDGGGFRPLENVALELPLFVSSLALGAAGSRVLRGRAMPQRLYGFALGVFVLMTLVSQVLIAVAYEEISVPHIVVFGIVAVLLMLPWMAAFGLLLLRSTGLPLGAGGRSRDVSPVPLGTWAGPLLIAITGLLCLPFALFAVNVGGTAAEREGWLLVLGFVVSLPIYPIALAAGIGLVCRSRWTKGVLQSGALLGVLTALLMAAGSAHLAHSRDKNVLQTVAAMVPLECASILPAWVLLVLVLWHRDKLVNPD